MIVTSPRPLPVLLAFVVGVAAVLIVAVAAAHAAEAAPVIAPDDPGGLAQGVYDAALAGRYKIVAGFSLMLIVFGLRSDFALGRVAWFKSRAGGVVLAGATSVLAVVGLALAADAPIQLATIANALGTALTAAGAWEWARDWLNRKAA